MKLDILTIPEYIEAMKSYYSEDGNSGEVVQCVSTMGYEFWTKCKTLEDIGGIYWKHEPLVKMEFRSCDDVIATLRRSCSSGITGCNFRWLPGNRAAGNSVILQPNIICGIDKVLELCNSKLKDRLCGILMDPFVYTGPDDVEEEYKKESNYRLFIKRITAAEYIKLEARYSDSFDGTYEDDYIEVYGGGFRGFKDEFSKFLKKNCPAFK